MSFTIKYQPSNSRLSFCFSFSQGKSHVSIQTLTETSISHVSTKQSYTWLNSDDHSRREFYGALYVVSVVNIHAKIMAHMMWTELTSHLQFHIIVICGMVM